MVKNEEIRHAMVDGIVFKGSRSLSEPQRNKMRTKVKKKTYITGLHGSAAAKKKAEIRKRRENRHKNS